MRACINYLLLVIILADGVFAISAHQIVPLPSVLEMIQDKPDLLDYLFTQSIKEFVDSPSIDRDQVVKPPVVMELNKSLHGSSSTLETIEEEKNVPVDQDKPHVDDYVISTVMPLEETVFPVSVASSELPQMPPIDLCEEIISESRCLWDMRFCLNAFIPRSALFRNIYGDAGLCYALEGTYYPRDYFGLWVNVDYFQRASRSQWCSYSTTDIKIANFSAGLKCLWKCCEHAGMYLGVGPCIAGVWIKNCLNDQNVDGIWIQNNLCRFPEYISEHVGGAVLKFGFNIYLPHDGLITINMDYFFDVASKMHIDGLKVGIGLGVAF